MKIHVLGTGVAITTKYYNTAFIFDDGESYFLVDGMGGVDILRQFEKLGLDWTKLHDAFLSHEHTDHLLGMVWVLRYIAHLMRLNEYDGEFHLYTHDVAGEKIREICGLLLQPKEIAFFEKRIFINTVRDRESREIWGNKFTFFDIHSTKAKQFGFKMNWDNGRTCAFLGDEPFCPETRDLCEGCEWMFSEAYCLYDEREIHTPYRYHHSTAKDAAETAESLNVKNLVLWHTEDVTTYGKRKQLYTEEARKYFTGKIYVPEDGEEILL